jgi:hypothetical protein
MPSLSVQLDPMHEIGGEDANALSNFIDVLVHIELFRMSGFQGRDTKLDKFFPKNQYS